MKKVFKYSLILIAAFAIGCTCTQLVLNSFAQDTTLTDTTLTLSKAVSITPQVGVFPQPIQLPNLGGERYQYQNDLGRLDKVTLTHSAWAEFGTRTNYVYLYTMAYLSEGERVYYENIKKMPFWQRVFFNSSRIPKEMKEKYWNLNWSLMP